MLPGMTLPAKAPENRPKLPQKERKLVFQSSIFRGELFVSGRVADSRGEIPFRENQRGETFKHPLYVWGYI